MKNKILAYFFGFCCSLLFNKIHAQEISDTTLVLGITNCNTQFGSAFTNLCYLDNTQFIPEGSVIFITDAIKCSHNEYFKGEYFEIVKNGEFFIIKRSEVNTTFDYFDILSEMNDSLKQNLKIATTQKEILYKIALAQKEIEERNQLINFLKNSQKQGICLIEKSAIDMSEYTEGTGASFTLYNPNKKDIKYVWITFSGYNKVDDKVTEFGKTNQTVQCIGPIKPDSYSKYEFEYVWMTDIVEYFKISQIKIQFMDNTTRIISSINSCTLPPNLRKYITE